MSRINIRRIVMKSVSTETRLEALEAQVHALNAHANSPRAPFKDAPEYTRLRAKMAGLLARPAAEAPR